MQYHVSIIFRVNKICILLLILICLTSVSTTEFLPTFLFHTTNALFLLIDLDEITSSFTVIKANRLSSRDHLLYYAIPYRFVRVIIIYL